MNVSGNSLSLGRNWMSADSAALVEFYDCARVDLKWDDGAALCLIADSKAEALAELARLGFVKSLA